MSGARHPRPRVLALFGPTAVGKSALAHHAALALGGEIIVADPFQRYRGLEIAADAHPPVAARGVRSHMVGDLDLAQASSAGEYGTHAASCIDGVLARGRVPIVAGGTALYVRAAIAEVGFPSSPEPGLRAEVEATVERDPAWAAAELGRLDPDRAAATDLDNPRRLARALELARGGAPAASGRLLQGGDRHPTLLVAVIRPRPALDARIAARVARELDEGLVREIDAALARTDLSREAAQVIGVREVRALRDGSLSEDTLADALAARTRRLARRQLAWLRRLPVAATIDLGARPAEAGLADLLRLWRDSGR